MKKIIIIISSIIILSIIGVIAYYNSDHYKFRIAEEMRSEKIRELDKIERHYIKEGVYSFEFSMQHFKSTTDKFGESKSTSEYEYLGKGEVSFKSSKIIILFKGIQEVILLGPPTIDRYSYSQNSTGYSFPVIQWKAFNTVDNTCFFQFDSTENQKKRAEFYENNNGGTYKVVSLNLTLDEFINNGEKEQTTFIEIGGTDSYGLGGIGFKCLPFSMLNQDKIILSKQEYLYSIEPPDYVDAKYEPEVYDIRTYLDK